MSIINNRNSCAATVGSTWLSKRKKTTTDMSSLFRKQICTISGVLQKNYELPCFVMFDNNLQLIVVIHFFSPSANIYGKLAVTVSFVPVYALTKKSRISKCKKT